jgi:hypothetical protein
MLLLAWMIWPRILARIVGVKLGLFWMISEIILLGETAGVGEGMYSFPEFAICPARLASQWVGIGKFNG